ncbi:MAG: type III-B CRISPR module RAMP protein Cmr4 [Methanobacteriota archaeon]|nr:MAG: type III-B CRISPR module RAMP protein Cmr4 [Euryarchaeota archaeon]
MKGKMLSIFAETQMHVGIGRSETFVDLPFAREGITEYPFIPGTGIKGSLRHHFEVNHDDANHKLSGSFGTQDNAGNIVFSDGRLLMLPIRSLSKTYYWVTCPYVLERLNRDLEVLGNDTKIPVPEVGRNEYVGPDHGSIVLEDREFKRKGNTGFEEITTIFEKFIPHESTKKRVKDQLIVLHDNDFKWFAKYGLMIQARNVLKSETKTSKNLWYEEWVATDTVFYAMLFSRNGEDDPLFEKFGQDYVQLGGNETVGQGICLFSEVRF